MLSWAVKKLEQLLDTVVDPLWQRILALPWAGRLTVLVVCATALATALHWEVAKSFIFTGVRAVAVALPGGSGAIPISNHYQRRVQEGAAQLTASFGADFSSRGNLFGQELGPWAPAQMVVALQDESSFKPDALTAFFHAQADSTCSCWREFPRSRSPRHIVVSGWVLFALAHLNSAPAPDVVRFILDAQSDEGWWPMFLYPKPVSREHASTYATAFSLLALNELLGRGLLAPEHVAPARETIRRGTSWLVTHRAPGQARWWDYPHSNRRKIFQSLSGLVFHTLHRVGDASSFVALDRQWLLELPKSLPSADACEISLVWTDTLDGPYQDHNCQIPLPWLLIATVDAYPNGTLTQRAKAVAWVERVLNETRILDSETLPENWKRAEMLISLKRLESPMGRN